MCSKTHCFSLNIRGQCNKGQVLSSSCDGRPFGHNTPTSQTGQDRQTENGQYLRQSVTVSQLQYLSYTDYTNGTVFCSAVLDSVNLQPRLTVSVTMGATRSASTDEIIPQHGC